MELPRLTALVNGAGAVDGRPFFPLDFWRRLEYFDPHRGPYTAFRSDYFRLSLIGMAVNPAWDTSLSISYIDDLLYLFVRPGWMGVHGRPYRSIVT
jgi:hypothetical protein